MSMTRPTDRMTLKSTWDKRRQEENRARRRGVSDLALTSEEEGRREIVRYCNRILTDAKKARKPHETFELSWALFNGDMWQGQRPQWRANITINKIRAFVAFMQAIMTDNKPRISVEPLVPGSEDAADLLRKLVDRDWDENDMQQVVSLWVLFGLIWGYAFIKVAYDPFADGGRGRHLAYAIPPYKIYTNRTATGCAKNECEYIIHVDDMTMGWVRRNFPKKAAVVEKLRGIRTDSDSEAHRNRDFVHEGMGGGGRISSAMNINGNIISPQAPTSNPNYLDSTRDTVEIQEFWLNDDTLESYKRQVVENGIGKMEPELDDDGLPVLQVTGQQTIVSEIDGQPTQVPAYTSKMKPVMEEAWRYKYPNGRLVVLAAGEVVLRDIPNPCQTDGFPFAMWKDYDVGGFHGQGEPLALRTMAFAINRIASQVFEILEKTGNPSWKLSKTAGVNDKTIKNKPGLVIPMDDIKGLEPLERPPTPPEFFKLFELVSNGMAEVSGINEAVKGSMNAANASFASIDQLQESGSAPIRQKVRNMESGLRRFGKLRIALIQQYDNGSRPLRASEGIDGVDGNIQSLGEASLKFTEYRNEDLAGQVEFRIAPISSLSTSPAGTWNRWLTLLDKQLIDEIAWHEKFRIEGWKTTLPRILKAKAQAAQADAALKKASKVGGSKSPAREAQRQRPRPANNQAPSVRDNAAVR